MGYLYEFEISAVCPVNGEVDVYQAALDTFDMVYVEDILTHVAPYAKKSMTQEDVTVELFERLKQRRSTLTTVGVHSGVTVTVTVES